MIIKGNIHIDNRGIVRFVNDFGFEGVKRFYAITHPTVEVIRAWQGHKKETKFFYVAKGSFLFNWIEVDDWDKPSMDLNVNAKVLPDKESEILVVKPGHVTGFKALEEGSVLLIFSDMTLKESKADDFRFDSTYWNLTDNR
jgi:dTDP-4-dehydrorhamnose 3,5-epimerase-like enzyme